MRLSPLISQDRVLVHPVYWVSAVLMDPADDRSHGLDDRVPAKSRSESREFWYKLVKRLTTPPASATLNSP
jgi:hypothetical protein